MNRCIDDIKHHFIYLQSTSFYSEIWNSATVLIIYHILS